MMESAVERTRSWIDAVVVGLNLCPFAGKVLRENRIRYSVSDTSDSIELLEALKIELIRLNSTPIEEIETTILIHPNVLLQFEDYNDFLAEADLLVTRLGFRGVFQIASFHPEYCFAGTDPDAIENATNRSPYPMLHILREASIDRVADDPEFLEGIPNRNIAVLRALGWEGLNKRWG